MDDPPDWPVEGTGWDPYDALPVSDKDDKPEPDKDEKPEADRNDENRTLHGEWSDLACRECGALDHFTRNCLKASSQLSPGRGCFKCGSESHNKKDCPELQDDPGEACFGCGEPGHFKSDCPHRRNRGACFNCGEEGHTKLDCPEPRIFKGVCRICEKEGHPAALCPSKPPDHCRNCLEEGHHAKDCTSNRKFDRNKIEDKLPEEGWAMMKEASDIKDLDDFREAFDIYCKAEPTATYNDIEKRMREEDFNIYFIALEKEPEDVWTLIDLQGQLDRKYRVRLSFSQTPTKQCLADRWPADAADNIERLGNAGLPYDRFVLKCRNCGDLGHGHRVCKEQRNSHERVMIKCVNCGGHGHRVRDCREDRKNPYGCRNCGAEDHNARECPEPRNAATVECRKCNQMGHYSRDCPQASPSGPRTCRNCGAEDHLARECPQPRDPSAMKCRNCDQAGHSSRDCPEPKDWSRVKCNRCGEMGHTVRRCPQPEDSDAGESNERFGQNDERTRGGWDERPRGEERTRDEWDDPVKEISQQLEDQQW